MKNTRLWVTYVALFALILSFGMSFTPLVVANEPVTEAEESSNLSDSTTEAVEGEVSQSDEPSEQKGERRANDSLANQTKEKASGDESSQSERETLQRKDEKAQSDTEKPRSQTKATGEVNSIASDDSVRVTVRVESNERTIVPPTDIEVTPFDVGEYTDGHRGDQKIGTDSPRAIHAIIRALEQHGIDTRDPDMFSLKFGGNYIAGIDGLFEFDRGWGSGWMYYIDHQYVPVGVLDRRIQDGESIVVFYTENFTDNTYSWFEQPSVSAVTDKPVTMQVKGLTYDVYSDEVREGPLPGAVLLVNGEPYEEDGEILLTNDNGIVEMTFSEPGKYTLSAERKNENGERNISRPYSEVMVEQADEGHEQEPDAERPVIEVDGLVSGMVVHEQQLVFTATATNHAGEPITPEVKLNGEGVPSDGAGRYRLSLRQGTNGIVVRAEDRAGHSVSRTFNVVFHSNTEYFGTVNEAIDHTSDYLLGQKVESEWAAIGLALADKRVPHHYNDIFYDNLDRQVINPRLFAKITDIERIALAAQAIGLDPTNIDGHDIISLIYNSADHSATGQDTMTFQGMNGPIFALIALDSGNFTVPSDARWTRERLIQYIVEQQNADGWWSLSPTFNNPSYDITAMALIAIGPYQDDANMGELVRPAVERAVAFLSAEQTEEGGFDDPFVGGISSEATAQVIIGLTAAGFDPTGDEFTQSGGHLLDHLLSFQMNDGGFKHVRSDTRSNAMATEQALQALVAYKRFIEGKGPLYNFTEDAPLGKPFLFVNGLEDGMMVTSADLTFTVTAEDANGDPLQPSVKWNGHTLSSDQNGTYKVSLTEGDNVIDIAATGVNGEKVQRTFTVVYTPKKNEQSGGSVTPLPVKHPVVKPEQPVAGHGDSITASETKTSNADDSGHRLPATATHLYSALLVGLLMLVIGVALIRQCRNNMRV